MTHRAIRESARAVVGVAAGDDTPSPDMQALLRKPLPSSATAVLPWTGSALGTVVQALADGGFLVAPQEGVERWHCPRAASCLLQPCPGDAVLVAGPHRDHLYLIAVVTQADASQSRIVTDGDLTISSRQGRIALDAPTLTLQAQKARLDIADMDYRGAEVRVTTLVARFVGRTLETVLDRLSVLTRSSFRLTEEVEQVRAGQIDMQASETLRLHAKNTLVTSKALVKVDAEQIHMG
ncbi:hypothetical protein J2W28_002369 [Variovorax boronicumulans]|uniref:DUF3540 domain-containing protein n=1 Tax=Variovorax boronicumulans TaxID=436515 RepID=UPI0027887CB5|nr:DUF3540 domain-containing protein [Variovorax boronicumulans]MDP9991414.1 hypothetical protein [Variovorax boronicumulans]MDQ0003222.1 hypothetical protein [Variovorax boronicumulans]